MPTPRCCGARHAKDAWRHTRRSILVSRPDHIINPSQTATSSGAPSSTDANAMRPGRIWVHRIVPESDSSIKLAAMVSINNTQNASTPVDMCRRVIVPITVASYFSTVAIT